MAINGNIWGGSKSGWVFQREILRLSTIIESQFYLLRQFLNGNGVAFYLAYSLKRADAHGSPDHSSVTE